MLRYNEITMLHFFKDLYKKVKDEDFVVDKSGVKMAEIIAPKFELNPKQKILNFNETRKTPEKYAEQELAWYDSQSLSIKGYVDNVKIWQQVSSYKKEVNSNYGWCIYSPDNYSQYYNCLKELIRNKDSRRAVMIYQRPSMWLDYNKDGMSDFICTDGSQLFIRNNNKGEDTLIYIVKQRSMDMIYGFFNDFYWHGIVYERMLKDLKKTYPNLNNGKIIYVPFSAHVYEKHFSMLKEIVNCEK